MDSTLAKPSIMGTSQRFPVNRHNPFNLTRNIANPISEKLLKGRRRHNTKQTPEGVVRRDTIRQFQKTLKPLLLGFCKPFYSIPVIGSAENRADRYRDDIH